MIGRGHLFDLSFADLGQGIGHGLVLNGPDRMGGRARFPVYRRQDLSGENRRPVFTRQEGPRQNGLRR